MDDVVANNIYSRSLPRLRDMIEQGRVRITYPDTKKVRTTRVVLLHRAHACTSSLSTHLIHVLAVQAYIMPRFRQR
jgi:hypothetical protein